MEDYPRNQQTRFASDEACRAYIEKIRWPNGFSCPHCNAAKYWRTKRGLMMCVECHRQTSVTAGTVFQDRHLSLRILFRVVWMVTNPKSGASAVEIQRMLGLTTYKSAWTLLQKLRRAMVGPGRDLLEGPVEIDETYIGGPEEGVRGRETEKKSVIVIAAEKRGRGVGRIRLRRIPDVSGESLIGFAKSVVKPASEIWTDAWSGYVNLGATGFKHHVTNIKRSGQLAHELLPCVHLVASLLKRWLLGTHQGAVSPEHLDYYLDEFTFRFNRRTSTHRSKLFFRLIEQSVSIAPAPYATLIKGVRGRKKKVPLVPT
jgi:transposase-like protein